MHCTDGIGIRLDSDSRLAAQPIQTGANNTIFQQEEVMQDWLGPEQYRGFLRGSLLKRIKQYPLKGGVEDLRKARHELDELIRLELDQAREVVPEKRAILQF
jgi:hypothetical protein